MSKVTTYVDYRRTDFDNGWERGDRRAMRGGLLLCAQTQRPRLVVSARKIFSPFCPRKKLPCGSLFYFLINIPTVGRGPPIEIRLIDLQLIHFDIKRTQVFGVIVDDEFQIAEARGRGARSCLRQLIDARGERFDALVLDADDVAEHQRQQQQPSDGAAQPRAYFVSPKLQAMTE